MSLIKHSFFPRSLFDMDFWLKPINIDGFGMSTLDIFDPFDDLDRLMCKNLMWLNKPEFFNAQFSIPKVPNKYRINVDCSGYNPNSIKTEVKDRKLIVSGSENENQKDTENYSIKEFRKTFEIPENSQIDKLVSFMTRNGLLVIEIPLKESEQETKQIMSDLFPKITESEDGKKNISMNISVPNNIDPSKLSVTCKDRDLIIKAQDEKHNSNQHSSVYYYKRTTLPENTDFDALKCNYDGKYLEVKAPLISDYASKNVRSIPIESSIKN